MMENHPGREELKKSLIIAGSIHVFFFLGLFPAIAQLFYPRTGWLELYMARQMLSGHIPYRDFPSEYPPLALLFFLLPGLFLQTTVPYSWAFATELILCDALVIFFMVDLSPLLKIPVKHSLGAYTLLILAVGPIVVSRYDILPAMLALAALWAFMRERIGLAWAAAALGVIAKMYPALIVPLFIIYHLKNRQYRQLAKGGAIFLAIVLIGTIPWLVIDAPGFWHSMSYHFNRGLHIESTYGTALLVGRLSGMTGMDIGYAYGSWNIILPLADRLAGISLFVVAGFLIVVYVLFALRLWRVHVGDPASDLLRYAALAVVVFMLADKVFSAQYLIWLCPLLPLIAVRRRYFMLGLFIIAAALTQYVYPYNYTEFVRGETWPVIILGLRDILLVAMAALMALPHRIEDTPYHIPGTSALRSRG
jgi:uncharacterized membrane protein